MIMFYKEIAPEKDLGQIIKCFWMLEHDYREKFHTHEHLWADANAELIFTFGLFQFLSAGFGGCKSPHSWIGNVYQTPLHLQSLLDKRLPTPIDNYRWYYSSEGFCLGSETRMKPVIVGNYFYVFVCVRNSGFGTGFRSGSLSYLECRSGGSGRKANEREWQSRRFI